MKRSQPAGDPADFYGSGRRLERRLQRVRWLSRVLPFRLLSARARGSDA